MALSSCGSVADRQGRELTVHGTSLFPIACYRDDFAVDTVPWHWHDELEFIIVDTGTAVVAVDGENYLIGQGDGCLINGKALHSVWPADTDTCRLHSAVFHPRLVGGSMESIFWQKYLQPFLSDAACRCICFDSAVSWNQKALRIMEDTWQTCVKEPPGYEFAVRSTLSELMYLLTEHRSAIQKSPSEKFLREAERIKTMLQYIQDHYGEALTIAQIAQSAAISESECLRCFRSMIGSTPIQYVKQLRVHRAAQLLLSTDQKIADIGAACGFQEMSYFARTFRQLKGVTPSEYRNQAEAKPVGS